MKRRFSRILFIGLALVLLVSLLAGCGGKEQAEKPSGSTAEPHKLSFSIGDPSTASKTVFYQNLADKTREATNGGLDITVYSGGTLFAHLEVCEGVLSGAADMGWFYTPWNPDQYPLTEVIGLPMTFGNQLAATYAIRKLHEETPELQEELSAFEILNLYSGPTNYIFSSKPVNKTSDLKGLQIRSFAGAATNLLTDWGASPLMISATEIYDSMDKGVIQGCIYEWSGIKSNTLYDVLKNVTYVPLVANPFTCIMNKESYKNIPEEYKATFDEIWAAPQTSFDFAEMFATECEDSRKAGVEQYGIKEIYPDEAAINQFRPAAEKYIQGWIEKYTTSSFDAGAYLERAKALYEEGCGVYPEWNIDK